MANLLFAAVILAFLIFIDLSAFNFHFRGKLFPWLVGIPCTIVMIIEMIKGIYRLRKAPPEEALFGQNNGDFRAFVVIIAWLAGFLVMVYALGFLVTIPLYSFLYMKVHGLDWSPSLVVAVVLTVTVYVIFPLGLKMNLYPGLIYLLYQT